MSTATNIAFVGLGSNCNAKHNIALALHYLDKEFSHLQQSPIYECPAHGYSQELEVQDFINLVVSFKTSLNAQNLIAELKQIEQEMGRKPACCELEEKIIDLDLLLFESESLESNGLEDFAPHPDILTCAYVLLPLSQLNPQGLHPEKQLSYQELWQQLKLEPHKLTEMYL